MFNHVPIPPDLLKIVNPETLSSPEGPSSSVQALIWTGVFTLVALLGCLLQRFAFSTDVSQEYQDIKARLGRLVRSTLLVRLCMIHILVVIPLIFYVNTKEHYWTSKHTTMLFMTALAMGLWLLVREHVPRFRSPFTWPIAMVMLGGSLSMLCAVNIAEGMGDLFAIFGSGALTFLSLQAFSSSKRLHLAAVIFSGVGLVLSLYGLSQAYLLLPMDFVYAVETRAPVSTVGNKNYASYYLDLAIPITAALAICRRSPLQTIAALAVYFICRWHFVLCDTRGGTISMTLGIILVTGVVAYYHGRRFRLLMCLILVEPMLWAAVNGADIHYADTQRWGKALNVGAERRAITGAAAKALQGASEEMRSALGPNQLVQWFLKGNEYFLGIQWRLPAIVIGCFLALAIFYLLVRHSKDWWMHLTAASILAFLPFWFVVFGTMPGNLASSNAVGMVIKGVQQADMAYRDIAAGVMGQFSPEMLKAAIPYNEMILSKQRDVAAMFSLSLFMVMATFLLFRWYDRKEGWAPGLATVGAMGLWVCIYFMMGADANPIRHLFASLASPLSHAWPIELDRVTAHHPMLAFLFSVFSFSMFSLLCLAGMVFVMQFLPAHMEKEKLLSWVDKGRLYGKYAVVALLVIGLLGVWFHPRIKRVRSEIWRTRDEGLVRALFYGAHAYFNTQGQVKGEAMDGPIGFRLEIYQGTLRKMRDNPILGVGPGNFKVVNPHPKYETALERRILGKEVLGRHPHNDFLEDATDSGGIALLGMIWVFGVAFLILSRSLKLIHNPRNSSDVFVNTMTWGLLWAMTAIVIHAQFEMPLLQPSSTYPAWMLLGICYQIWRIQRRRMLANQTDSPLLVSNQRKAMLASNILSGAKPEFANAAVYELPPATPDRFEFVKKVPAYVAFPVMLLAVALLTGNVLVRQFVGEMWLRWGMIFSEAGVERFDYVFKCMEKSQDIYPLEMETNYILGRYCIDATSKVFRPWNIAQRASLFTPEELKENEQELLDIRKTYHLDPDKIIDYAQLGIDVHKRDIFMNPNYKWAHNNMGVLYDKMNQIYDTLSENAKTEAEKAKYQQLAYEAEMNSRNCYNIALEIDDLQVYALYNLGHGAMRDQNVALACKYFERTLLADPNRLDVNFFIGKCRMAMKDIEGGIKSFEDLFAWTDKSKGNKLEDFQKREAEANLSEVARYLLNQRQDPGLVYRATMLLAKRFDRCKYLPRLAHAAVNNGSPTECLKYVAETYKTCGQKISSEVVYAQAKAHSVLSDTTAAVSSIRTLLRSPAGEMFRKNIQSDPEFEVVRKLPVYEELIKEKPKPAAPKKTISLKPKPTAPEPVPETAAPTAPPSEGPVEPSVPAATGQ